MNLYVVRHAHAGSRSNWSGDDRLRPLSKKGWRQAEAIADALTGPGTGSDTDTGIGIGARAGAGIDRLISSPSLRCVETLRPLADRIGLVVDGDDRLAEGSDGEAALELAEELRRAGTVAVLCSHGDVIPELLWCLKANGTTFHHDVTWPKASVWQFTGGGTHWTDAIYLYDPKA